MVALAFYWPATFLVRTLHEFGGRYLCLSLLGSLQLWYKPALVSFFMALIALPFSSLVSGPFLVCNNYQEGGGGAEKLEGGIT